MKQHFFKGLIGAFAVAALSFLFSACATDTVNVAGNGGGGEMERALLASGFKARTASTTVQRHNMVSMPDHQFELVRQNGNDYYVYASKRSNRLFVGDRWAYQAYQGYVRNNELRKQGVFVYEVHPGDRANNRTVDIYNGYPPFRSF